jgi:hypothetical protein
VKPPSASCVRVSCGSCETGRGGRRAPPDHSGASNPVPGTAAGIARRWDVALMTTRFRGHDPIMSFEQFRRVLWNFPDEPATDGSLQTLDKLAFPRAIGSSCSRKSRNSSSVIARSTSPDPSATMAAAERLGTNPRRVPTRVLCAAPPPNHRARETRPARTGFQHHVSGRPRHHVRRSSIMNDAKRPLHKYPRTSQEVDPSRITPESSPARDSLLRLGTATNERIGIRNKAQDRYPHLRTPLGHQLQIGRVVPLA